METRDPVERQMIIVFVCHEVLALALWKNKVLNPTTPSNPTQNTMTNRIHVCGKDLSPVI